MCRKQSDGSYKYCPSVLNRRRKAGLPVGPHHDTEDRSSTVVTPPNKPSYNTTAPAHHTELAPLNIREQYATAKHGDTIPHLVPLTPATTKLINELDNIPGVTPRVVGGAVRDAFLDDSTPKDIDIELAGVTDLTPVSQHLRRNGINVDEVGKSFGVLTVRIDGASYDISLPRTDNKTGEGHKGFTVDTSRELTDEEATSRRDYTINAMMWEPKTGKIVDPHNGLDDMRNHTLRHVSDAFSEDPLRVLRGIQFAGRFGYTIHPDTIKLCQQLAPQYDSLSRERVYGEWNKIFTKSRKVSDALTALKQTGWLQHYPELAAIDGVEQGANWHPEGDVYVHSGLAADYMIRECNKRGIVGDERERYVIGAMCHDLGKATHTQHREDGRITSYGHDKAGSAPLGKFLDRIAAPKNYYKQIEPIVREHMCSIQKPSPKSVRKLAERLYPATIQQWSLVVDADKGGRLSASQYDSTKEWVDMAREQQCYTGPQNRLVTGDDLTKLGLKPGPKFGEIMKEAYRAQMEGKIGDASEAREWVTREVMQRRNNLEWTDRSIIDEMVANRSHRQKPQRPHREPPQRG